MILAVTLAMAAAASGFDATADAFTGCLASSVRMGMTMRMKPDDFAVGFAKSCLSEQAAFRAESIKRGVELGRTEAEATAETDGNIANGRRIYAADQAKFYATGEVPR
ncbi:hypothetical protein [Glacieibacterium frigidum]|uniref:Uncharacterized protein n=1 Tax=Glacieibacterium frigidum TaxID=2593303 RepID=A0A552UGT4_9SPHN|nr:hypothetical protein [Glacieibacterium frigidum]TRW17424.1 hypothetical protein FMM06_04465 [Glacieibacterium frigidum]